MIVPLLDLRLRLGLPARPSGRSARILIVSREDEPYGLLVDEVYQVERIAPEAVEPPPAMIGGAEGEFIAGIGRPEGRLVILLDLEAVLSFEVS
jgi:purine-binding chemotaxis protein CheW